jgi:methionine-rich copper-binding protein CopC
MKTNLSTLSAGLIMLCITTSCGYVVEKNPKLPNTPDTLVSLQLDTINPPSGSFINESFNECMITFSSIPTQFAESLHMTMEGSGIGDLAIQSIEAQGGGSYRILFSGKPVNDEILFHIEGLTDASGRSFSNQSFHYYGDIIPPEILTLTPANGSTIGKNTKHIKITYSESVSGAHVPGNYIISGTGAGTLSVESIIPEGGNQYTLTLAGESGDGPIDIGINGVIDRARNSLVPEAIELIGDAVSPAVILSNPLNGSYINATIAEITLTYSKPVTGANLPENYKLTGAGSGSLQIASVTQIDETNYTLELVGTPVDGDINIAIDNVADTLGNPLTGSPLLFHADVTMPLITSINPDEGNTINSMTTAFHVEFSEEIISGDNISNYILTGAGLGTLKFDSVVRGLGNMYDIILSGRPGMGTLQLEIKGIEDLAANRLAGPSVFSYNADGVLPFLLQVTPPSGSKINGTFAQADITFSEDVANADVPENYIISGTGAGTLAITSILPLSGTQYQIFFSGSAVHGNIAITMLNITDAAGNNLTGGTINYTRDLLPPSISMTQPADGAKVKQGQFPLSLVVHFSEPVTNGKTVSNYLLSGSGAAGLRVGTVLDDSSDNTRFIVIIGGATPAVGSTLSITTRNIKDADGNTMGPIVVTLYIIAN